MTAVLDGPPPAPAPAPAPERRRHEPSRHGRHPAVRIPTLVVGGILALALVLLSAHAVANVLVSTTERDTATLTGPIRRVEVRVDGSVHIRSGPADRAEIIRRSTFGVQRPTVEQRLVDGLLTIRVTCRAGLNVLCDNRLDLVVPRDVTVATTALGTTVTDIDGSVEIDSGAGSVTLTRVAGRVIADVGAGAITGRDLRSTEVRATAGAGSVDLQFSVAPTDVDADSGAGSVTVTVPRGEEAYRVETDAGAGHQVVQVRTDPASERVIRASSGAGDVDVLEG